MAIQTVRTGAAANDGAGDDARTAFTKINQNFTNSANAASRQVGIGEGNVMEVGAYGLGTNRLVQEDDLNTKNTHLTSRSNFWGYYSQSGSIYSGLTMAYSNDWFTQIRGSYTNLEFRNFVNGDTFIPWRNLLHSGNTSVDGNGFIKAASPIVKLFADKIEINDEAAQQDITFEKLGVGDYLIKGSLGFAQEGWYIEMPKDANGNALVAVAYEQLTNGDISVKTYDYMLNKKGRIGPDLETPLDIPETRWVDLRLQSLPQPVITPPDNQETVIKDA